MTISSSSSDAGSNASKFLRMAAENFDKYRAGIPVDKDALPTWRTEERQVPGNEKVSGWIEKHASLMNRPSQLSATDEHGFELPKSEEVVLTSGGFTDMVPKPAGGVFTERSKLRQLMSHVGHSVLQTRSQVDSDDLKKGYANECKQYVANTKQFRESARKLGEDFAASADLRALGELRKTYDGLVDRRHALFDDWQGLKTAAGQTLSEHRKIRSRSHDERVVEAALQQVEEAFRSVEDSMAEVRKARDSAAARLSR